MYCRALLIRKVPRAAANKLGAKSHCAQVAPTCAKRLRDRKQARSETRMAGGLRHRPQGRQLGVITSAFSPRASNFLLCNAFALCALSNPTPLMRSMWAQAQTRPIMMTDDGGICREDVLGSPGPSSAALRAFLGHINVYAKWRFY